MLVVLVAVGFTLLLLIVFVTVILSQYVPLCSHAEENQKPTPINTFKSIGHKSCNQTFQSPTVGSKQGTFIAPLFTNEQNLTNHSHSCIFMFIAQPNEQVSISFTSFKLRSSPPDCKHEFLDFYTELNNEDLDLKNAKLSSRNCGSQLPKQRVSLKQRLAFVYNNDLNTNNDTYVAFEGKYEFIKAEPFTLVNKTNDECIFEIKSTEQKEGSLQSLTYPGIYNIPLDCIYKFNGETGQRIKIVFYDFDIFFGGSHCPFDFIKIWDGDNMNSSLIGTYCGQKRSFTIFSTRHKLLMQFKTTKRLNKASENRGFTAWYEFSEHFVNLGFIEKNNGELILGTECDFKIFSKGEHHSNHLISPNYPFNPPSSTQCAYYLYGLHDKITLQKIRIQFEKFDLPNNDSVECLESSLRIHTSDPPNEDPDYVFCGTDHPPNNLASNGAIMVIVFKTNNLQQNGQGFKLQYTFETDYRIEGGTIKPPGCNFIYSRSKSAIEKTSGIFNSPRYPSSYSAETTCTYQFIPFQDELIMITFQNFRLQKESRLNSRNSLKKPQLNSTLDILNGYGDEACDQDWVEIYELPPSANDQDNLMDPNFSNQRKARSLNLDEPKFKDQKLFSLDFDNLINEENKNQINSQEQYVNNMQQNKIGRFCSYSAPGPIVTSQQGSNLKVIFRSDSTGFASGFLASYAFKNPDALPSYEKCDYLFDTESINTTTIKSSMNKYRIITSPGYPNPYRSIDKWCNWIIKIKKGFRILLQFQFFSIEGDMRQKGCPKAVVRIWRNKNTTPIDLCGDNLTNNTKNILSDDNYMKISFISSSKAVGAAGFKAIWSEFGY